jgi:hypothetical protein
MRSLRVYVGTEVSDGHGALRFVESQVPTVDAEPKAAFVHCCSRVFAAQGSVPAAVLNQPCHSGAIPTRSGGHCF